MFKKLLKVVVAFKAIPRVLKAVFKGAAVVGAGFIAVKGFKALKDSDADLFVPARLKNIGK